LPPEYKVFASVEEEGADRSANNAVIEEQNEDWELYYNSDKSKLTNSEKKIK